LCESGRSYLARDDFKLLQMSWIFDINFKPTLRSVKSRRYLEMIRDVLPKSKEIRNIYCDSKLS
jgi:hypothetical protein